MSQNLFKIYDGRDHFWQWDTGQKLIVLNNDVDQVHFSNNKMTYAIVKEVFTDSDGTRICEVPDVILKAPNSIIAYAYVIEEDQNRTIDAIKYSVHSRQAPEDYTYEENNRFKDLVNKIELIEDAVEKVTDVKKFDTIEEAEQWAMESNEVGRVIAINIDSKWTAYMVDSDHSISKVHDNSDLIEYIDNLSKLIGNESVSDQIKNAIEALDLSNTYASKSHNHTKDDITDFAHTHEIADVDGLQDALDGKQPSGDYALKSDIKEAPVQSVNGQTGNVEITVDSIGAQPSGNYALQSDIDNLGKLSKKDIVEKSDFASDVQASLNKADTALQSYTETDPTVPAWAKAATKPTYTASEVGALPDTTEIPSIEGLATEKYVDDKIVAIPTPDVSGQIDTHNASTNAHANMGWLTGEDEVADSPVSIDADTLGGRSASYFEDKIAEIKNNNTVSACIKGSGAPTESTVADVGFFYMDTLTGDVWKCVAVYGGKYVWKYLNHSSGGNVDLDTTLTQSGKAADAKAVGDALASFSGGSGSPDAVKYTAQGLTDEQKAQARENIGAVSIEEVEEMLGIEEEFSVSGELVEFNADVKPDTELEVISKIHRDETWGESNKLLLHQVSGSNFVDFSNWLGGVGTVFEKNGLTATINANSTVTISGTNESDSRTAIISKYLWSGEHSARVYPAGTYTIPKGFTMAVRAAQYPKNVAITGMGNLNNTVTIPEPFRIIFMEYGVKAGVTVDVTLPLGLFRGNTIPETGYEYYGQLHTVTFDTPIYEGEFNWQTGELKDADGNTVGYYDVPKIKRLAGTNYFWTCFGENTVSNRKNDGKVILRLNETAPEDTIPSICDFMFTPTTPEAAYGLYYAPFLPNGQFYGNEVPVLTTKGTLSVRDANGNVKYSKYIEPMFNTRGVSDVLTQRGLEKKWSKKFYLNKEPISITSGSSSSGAPVPYVFIWEFDESEFINTGIPAKIHDIAIASPCFRNNDNSENNVNTQVLWNGDPYPAFFSYNVETGKYTLTARGIQGSIIKHQLTTYSKVHFYYQLETAYTLPFNFAMGIDAGDKVSFEPDLIDNQPYIDAFNGFKVSVDPSITAFIPRNVEGAMSGMNNAARILNMDNSVGGDATVQGYSWIGAGDGVTDYTVQIQAKLDELRIFKGGSIHLGPGTYPISKSLIVYGNTQIIGDGHTIIEQRTDNTHAVIWNGSNICMQDLTIKLAGECTELTGCIYVNSYNTANGERDERYPENYYVQYCSTNNVKLIGTYGLSWNEGYQYLSDEALTYRGVGVYCDKMYFNFCDNDGLTLQKLYTGVYGGGGSNNHRICVVDSRFAVYGGGGLNDFKINGHALYGYNQDGQRIIATDCVFYGVGAESNMITIAYYDIQYAKGIIYFDGACKDNHYTIPPSSSGISTTTSNQWGHDFDRVIDYGRGNVEVQPVKENFVGVGSSLFTITQLPYWNTKFDPSIHNVLSGAGIWGNITSNKEWQGSDGFGLSDICRYPKETNKTYFGLAAAICRTTPSEESPVEIIIDISDRPTVNYLGFWIQFDHRYVAEDFTISFDTTNDGTFDRPVATTIGNINPITYKFNYQEPNKMVYRIKISITKALQIPELKYEDAGYGEHTVNYNPDGYVGIVNIGMPSNEVYGRAFLGECGGSLYGNVDMHNNTLKNLPSPVDDGDAVSKAYVDDAIDEKVENAIESHVSASIENCVLVIKFKEE